MEIKALTLLEFNMVLDGYVAREEEEWDRTRNLMAFIATFSGLGSKKPVNPSELLPLSKDILFLVSPIRTYNQAMELLNELSEAK